ncbi:hypothetical protein [Streptomyces sp. NPDC059398]|uniref:hypothetical protein n=1 Tax=Streptomyces sp. NPDC059398 TaxID=3346820 RepID=UPI003686D13C
MSPRRSPEHGPRTADSGHVLVVGATRVLRPAVLALAERGTHVTAVARSATALDSLVRACAGEVPGDVTPLAADATGPGFPGRLRDAARPASPGEPRDATQPGFSGEPPDAEALPALTGALVYSPALPPGAAASCLRGLLGGPCVLLLPSRWADPAEAAVWGHGGAAGQGSWTPALLPPEARPAEWVRPLVLGWRAEEGGTRWHTPEEISAAALELLDAPAPAAAVLGRVRPWAGRPG